MIHPKKCYLSGSVCELDTCENCKHMAYSLFLDDVRKPKDVKWIELPLVEWVIVRNFDQFITYIKLHGVPSRISFDHDLAPQHYDPDIDWKSENAGSGLPTGLDCVKWLCDYCLEHKHKFPPYLLHSLNAQGRLNMDSYIQAYIKANETTD